MVQSRRAAPSKATADAASAETSGPRILKKYPNRRLYDTETSSYITLADVKKMVLTGQAFVVRDAKTSDDLTRSILLQIILEEETGGVPMFSSQTLAQIIRFYGHAMQGMMGSYLEKNLQTFTDIQSKLAEQSKGLYDPKVMSPELWTQFLNGQAPVVQGLMGNYLEQSKQMFVQMQEQMAKQAETLFPVVPGFTPPKR
jgi:polyhydroxyalkanoate synthesis repressor PhaR